MKKLLFILLVFSSQSFAQEYIEPNELPFGKKLEHSDTLSFRDTYIFYSNGLVHHSYYYDSNRDGKYNQLTTAEGVWTTHPNSKDSINILLGTTNCIYKLEKVADLFVFRLPQFYVDCKQKLLRIKKD
jgi:hypothetical protein